jgi:acyl carrier protein
MSENEKRDAVTAFFAGRGKPATGDDVDLFETQYIDSMELLELIMHLEDTLQVSIDQDLMSVDNFRTIAQIIKTIGTQTG